MTATQLLFWLFALSTCGGAVAVVVSQNVVRMAFWLIVSLGSTSGLFFLLNADFVGATQLLIYVGGTLVLLIFGVMLTASGPYVQIKSSWGEIFLAAGIGGLFLALTYFTVASVNWNSVAARVADAKQTSAGHNAPGQGNTARPIGLKLIGSSPGQDLNAPAGSPLSTGYLLPFEIVSVHLLVVLVGAAYLARAKRRVDISSESINETS